MQYQVRSLVDELGVEVVVDGPFSRQPRLLSGGQEPDRDAAGTYLVRDASGGRHSARIVADLWRLGVAVEVDGRRYPAGRDIPVVVRLALLLLVVLGVLSGLVGAVLALLVAWSVVALLRHPEQRRSRDVTALALLAVALVAMVSLLAGLRAG